MRIVTFNIHAGVGRDRLYDLNRICALLRAVSPDIVGLNEVDSLFHKRSHYEDSLKIVAASLNMNYIFGPALYRDPASDVTKGAYGNGLLSRYPILSQRIDRLNVQSKMEPRVLLSVCIEVEGQEIEIGVTHLSLIERQRIQQASEIMNVLPGNKPTILMGDMNAKSHQQSMVILRERFHDVWEVKGNGNGYTYSSGRPRKRIDYMYVSDHFDIVDTKILNHEVHASDHLPLMADVRLK